MHASPPFGTGGSPLKPEGRPVLVGMPNALVLSRSRRILALRREREETCAEHQAVLRGTGRRTSSISAGRVNHTRW